MVSETMCRMNASPRALSRRGGISAAACVVMAAVAVAAPAAEPAAWSLRDGDRVVVLGDTFVEREGDRGFIETALVAAHPEVTLSFRNLGWSADTVWAESRGVFDPPVKGYQRMLALVHDLRPTIVFIAYGRNESERGPAGIDAFRGQLAKLCDDVRREAGGGAPADVRLVLVTPHRFETIDADPRNARLAEYCRVIRDVAADKQAGLVDLYADLPTTSGTRLTENGLHLSDAGYAEAARVFAAACGRPLPDTFAAESSSLRELVVQKNRLFFHRWRPTNETYIFLFRKHEQGNNAVEIPQFDPLVAAAEQQVRAKVEETR